MNPDEDDAEDEDEDYFVPTDPMDALQCDSCQ